MLRLGLIGCGGHGRTLASAAAEVEDAVIGGFADVDIGKAENLARDAGGGYAFSSAEAMLKAAGVDAVLIATPHPTLRDGCLEAIEAGKHVFVEKPMALNAAEGAEIVAAARAADLRLMVGYCLRFAEIRTKMQSLLGQGCAGDVQAISAGKGGDPLTGWLAEADSGGGQLLFLGSHLVDQIIWLLGEAPVEIYASVTYRQDTGSDETSAFQMRFPGGAVAQCIVSQAVGSYFDFVEFMGRNGRVRSDWPLNTIQIASPGLATYGGGLSDTAQIRVTSDPRMPMYVAEIREFVDAGRSGRDPSISGEEGLTVLRVLDAVVESANSGIPVTLNANRPVVGRGARTAPGESMRHREGSSR